MHCRRSGFIDGFDTVNGLYLHDLLAASLDGTVYVVRDGGTAGELKIDNAIDARLGRATRGGCELPVEPSTARKGEGGDDEGYEEDTLGGHGHL